jgi:membrane-associated phospholipid phosphatase
MTEAAEAVTLRRLDRLIWAVVAAVAMMVLAAPILTRFYIAWRTFAAPAAVCLVLMAGASFYRRWRTDLRLASGLEATAQLVAFAAVGAPLSYMAAAADLPLVDHALDLIDHAVGLDWLALLGFMNANPALYALLRPIYLSLTLQMTIVTLCLAFSGRLIGLRVYMLAFILAALVTIALSAVLPAVGVWPHDGLTAAASPHVTPAVSTSWPVFHGLREGGLRALVAVGSEGIITFPSLHAALAVILIAALRPIPVLRWLILVLNMLMLAATPIDGSHYFVDVFAGILVAALCLFVARAIAAMAVAKHAAGARSESKIPRLAAGDNSTLANR